MFELSVAGFLDLDQPQVLLVPLEGGRRMGKVMNGTFRLASFNVESLDEVTGAAITLEERVEILRPQLGRINANILCLQEVNAQRRRGSGPMKPLFSPHREWTASSTICDDDTSPFIT